MGLFSIFGVFFLSYDYTDPVKLNHALPRPTALEVSSLGRLPPELISAILRYLDPEEAISFTLSCRPFYFMLRQRTLFRSHKLSSRNRGKFLTLLEKDLPNHVACTYCYKFHAIATASRHLPSNRQRKSQGPSLPCWQFDESTRIDTLICCQASSTIFSMLMKTHRQGHDTSYLLGLLRSPVITIERKRYAEQIDASFRIVNNSLLFREQRRFIASWDHSIWFFDLKDKALSICPHQVYPSFQGLCQRNNIHDMRTTYSFVPNNQKLRPWGIIPCQRCHTEFRVDFDYWSDRRAVAVYITRWVDLGGFDVSNDHRFKDYLYMDGQGINSGDRHSINLSEKGSICEAFENVPYEEWDFDSIVTDLDRKKLMLASWSR
ncbi:uncharacterized protein PAC_04485 [Phialocephala subalpina]|uniref:F-box domain-containing protein n=1 Tax=Phialocephala subalpina TaxID=576137 RepID=A0A1L7WPD5_9HELO|nr:uncharacterized protein PAC_04485 [Phialocephala subalpina]